MTPPRRSSGGGEHCELAPPGTRGRRELAPPGTPPSQLPPQQQKRNTDRLETSPKSKRPKLSHNHFDAAENSTPPSAVARHATSQPPYGPDANDAAAPKGAAPAASLSGAAAAAPAAAAAGNSALSHRMAQLSSCGESPPPPPSKVLHVRNIPRDATKNDLEDVLSEYGLTFVHVVVKYGAGLKKHQAFVELRSIADAVAALERFQIAQWCVVTLRSSATARPSRSRALTPRHARPVCCRRASPFPSLAIAGGRPCLSRASPCLSLRSPGLTRHRRPLD